MGQRTKGNMWCKRDGPVLGVKNTHRIRNTGALVGSVALPGAFIFGKVEGYYCPKCGEKVRPAWTVTDKHVEGEPAEPVAPRVTPDGAWITLDDGETFVRTATLPPPPAPTTPA
ncbi:MAG TPA: hypothetical protein VKQ71_15040 [Acidimicrobiales bacterium]|nr:hypothetical protein [Acidimicrobiales bacterium]